MFLYVQYVEGDRVRVHTLEVDGEERVIGASLEQEAQRWIGEHRTMAEAFFYAKPGAIIQLSSEDGTESIY